MLLEDFDYDLPEERIAQTPIEPRNASRLMVLNPVEKTISHDHFYNLKKYIVPGDTLIFNDTRVMPARLIGHRDKTGGKVEVFLLRRLDADHWETLVKPGKKAQVGNVINFSDELSCIVTEHTDFGGRVVEFHYEGIFEEILDRLAQHARLTGHVASGLFANDDSLAQDLLQAGEESLDRAWQMPLWDDYQDLLKSNFADVGNVAGRAGGSITAAKFLQRFVGDAPWAHLDIAGTAWKEGAAKGATGRPVALLLHYLLQRAA